MIFTLQTLGLGVSILMISALIWSLIFPQRRIWPPLQSFSIIKLLGWILTSLIFLSAILIALLDWNSLSWPAWFRWLLGPVLFLGGNAAAWYGVRQLGLAGTSGDATGLKTSGLYRYSRHPQYVADMAILLGILIWSGSFATLSVVASGIMVLILAPIAEEVWLTSQYDRAYKNYMRQVRRYI